MKAGLQWEEQTNYSVTQPCQKFFYVIPPATEVVISLAFSTFSLTTTDLRRCREYTGYRYEAVQQQW